MILVVFVTFVARCRRRASLHAKHPELRLWNRRVEGGRQSQRQGLARPGGIEDPVVPQPGRRIVGRALALVLRDDGIADRGLLLGAERLSVARELVALDRREHAGGLLAAHDGNARVGPHPEQARLVRPSAHAVRARAGRPAAPPLTRVNFATTEFATAGTISAPSFAIPPRSYCRPTMNPVMFCRNTSGIPRRLHSSMKCVAFSADSENSTPLFATTPTSSP